MSPRTEFATAWSLAVALGLIAWAPVAALIVHTVARVSG